MTTSSAPAAVFPERPRRTGRTAFTMAILVLTISLVVSIAMGILATPYAIRQGGFVSVMLHANPDDPRETVLFIAAALHVLAGTVFGIWAIVLGIVAISTGRGRRGGVWAIVLPLVAPIASLAIYLSVAVSLS